MNRFLFRVNQARFCPLRLHTGVEPMSKKAPADAPEKTSESSTSKLVSRVWPKLLLWSLVLAFGFLYLRSLDYSGKDYPQAEAPKPAAPPHAGRSCPSPLLRKCAPAAPVKPVEPSQAWRASRPGQRISSASAPRRIQRQCRPSRLLLRRRHSHRQQPQVSLVSRLMVPARAPSRQLSRKLSRSV